MHEAARAKAAEMIDRALHRIERLRAMGPNPFDYWIWADETTQALETIFGRDAEEPRGFAQIANERGRAAGQRGVFDTMTLGIHGEWGIRARLNRAEAYLTGVSRSLGAGAGA